MNKNQEKKVEIELTKDNYLVLPIESGSTPEVEEKLREKLWVIFKIRRDCWNILKDHISNYNNCIRIYTELGYNPEIIEPLRRELAIMVDKIISTPAIQLINAIEAHDGNTEHTHSERTNRILQQIIGSIPQKTVEDYTPEELRNKYNSVKLEIEKIKKKSVSIGRVLEEVMGYEFISLNSYQETLIEEGILEYHIEMFNKLIDFIGSLKDKHEKIEALQEQYESFLISKRVRRKRSLSPLTGLEIGTNEKTDFITAVIENENQLLSTN